ncbi:MAG: hypothetical protein OXE84_01325 [Rhodobacteraceae bacterium]|nr:hypothetical protein [Paracoccaceae bacterium]MCY4326219.1 hypothetical protein [Paracoccaceae bacterium]
MVLAASAFLFTLFALNVGLGAVAGSTFLSDVQEMLVLFGCSITFAVGVLQREIRTRAHQETGVSDQRS